VKLLLDVHHSPKAARRLREQGFDVVAASEDGRATSMPDDELLRFATSAGRAVVTENVKDFDRIVRSWTASGEHHCGVVFTSPRRFHRGSVGYPENLIKALERMLVDPPNAAEDWVRWLD
jgi:ribosomal protein L34